MSLPFTEKWFSLSARRNRQSFIFAAMSLNIVMIIVFAMIWFFEVRGNAFVLIFALFFAPYFVCGYTLSAQRLRDMNLTGWLALLWLPASIADNYVGGATSLALLVILCVVPGTRGENRYGPDPLEEWALD
ncbi:DUF805 domain-containing protein [Nitratireductor aquimarinus]|uniref:DUF805 domain-containing protein n=1 Tax=Nitratireductor aquimarinus TaxID=889300 RepID=UPI003742AA13